MVQFIRPPGVFHNSTHSRCTDRIGSLCFAAARLLLMGTGVWPDGTLGRIRTMKNCETLDRMLQMSAGDREKTGRIVARSFYNILRRNGFTQAQIMDVAGQLLDGVIKDMKVNGKDRDETASIERPDTRSPSREVA